MNRTRNCVYFEPKLSKRRKKIVWEFEKISPFEFKKIFCRVHFFFITYTVLINSKHFAKTTILLII